MGLESIESAFNDAEAIEPTPEVIEGSAVKVEAPEIEAQEPAAEPIVETPKDTPRTVPLPTFLDQRDELKEAKRKLAEYEASIREPVVIPDPYDKPEEFAQFQEQRLQHALIGQKFQMSEVMAKQAHGAEVVDTAAKWAEERAKSDPSFAASYMKEAHPIDWIVRQHARDSLISQLPENISSLDELINQKIAERGLTAVDAATVVASEQQQVSKQTPARSLASTPSVHGGVKDVPVGPMVALGTVFR